METAHFNLRYTGERDKACGIAGMAITMVACDAMHLVSEIDFDAAPGSNMRMVNVFAAEGNPRMSAKVVWNQSIKDLRAVLSMVLGNIACRQRLGTGASGQQDSAIRTLVREQGATHCSLDTDECDALMDDCRNYVMRIFRHHAIPSIADSMSRRIIERRHMSAAEIVEYLASLGLR